MSEIARLSRAAAKENPAEVFASPWDIVAEVMLTRGEKRGALERWRRDVLHEISAATEGMRTHGLSGQLVEVLDEIEAALQALSREDDLVLAK